MENINITKLNTILKVASDGKSLDLSNKKFIALSLVDKLSHDNINLIFEKVKKLNTLNEVLVSLLNDAKDLELSELKKTFIYMSISNSNMYIYSQMFEKVLPLEAQLINFINNTMNVYNTEIIDTLLNLKRENIVFNIYRKTKSEKNKLYILENKSKFTNANIKYYLNK